MQFKHRVTGTFPSAVRKLRRKMPVAHPVRVFRRDLSNHKIIGRTYKVGKKFYIEIDENLEENDQVWILLHEWAHAMSWYKKRKHESDHGDSFKLAFGDVVLGFFGFK